MSADVKIKNSDLLRQVLDRINSLELRFYEEDMNELNTLLSFTSIHTQRVNIITAFSDQKRKELININDWCRYKPQTLASSVMIDLKKNLKTEEENFIIPAENLPYFIGEISYPLSIASITVLFRILSNLDKMLVKENMSVAHEPQGVYQVSSPQNHSSSLVWNSSDTAFIELFASVFEVDALRHESRTITRKEMFDILAKTFNLNIKDLESKLSRAKRRKKNETPFLDSLRSAFLNACSRKAPRY